MTAFLGSLRLSLIGLMAAAATLHAGASSVVKADRTNIRAKPSFDGEVLTTLNKGDLVEVLDEVPGTGVDGALRTWAKIALPKQAPVWVYGPLVDSKTKTVKSKVLNLRAGPGRNYSELGELVQGTSITVVRELDGWLQIEPPPSTVGFVATNLIEVQGAAATQPAPTPAPAPETKVASITPPPAAITPPPAQPVPTPTVESTPPPATPAPAVVATATPAPETKPEPAAPVPSKPRKKLRYQEPLRSVPDDKEFMAAGEPDSKPREVLREGLVGPTWSVQAPGYHELMSLDKEGKMDYLISETPDIDLTKYRGLHVLLSGEEWRDSRWRTPLLKVKSIQVVN
ncbi:MAG TPA: SH3 domain-containing protein [Candidatus Limnocylindria bacterium]|jgi:uncharacterized protein YgiM (DUF1202 family)|nr:SH3 domain-containing protein [Candidatus Limnocylindria bacterium]